MYPSEIHLVRHIFWDDIPPEVEDDAILDNLIEAVIAGLDALSTIRESSDMGFNWAQWVAREGEAEMDKMLARPHYSERLKTIKEKLQ